MKPFVFKLQTALDLRLKEEEMQREELFRATRLYRENLDSLHRLRMKQTEVYEIMRGKLIQTVDVMEIKNCNDYIPVINERIKQQEYATETARREMDQVRCRLVETMKNRKMLEKLRARHHQEYLKECMREEQKQIDEMATVGFIRRDSAV